MSLTEYLGRVLLATIRDMGDRPCPRCLVPKDKLDLMGTVLDNVYRIGHGIRIYFKNTVEKARRLIYFRAKGISSVAVEALRKETSSVPTLVSYICLTRPGIPRTDLNFTWIVSECIHWPSWRPIWTSTYACCSLYAWIWVGSMESNIHAIDSAFVCPGRWWRVCQWAWPTVSAPFNFWAQPD